MKLSVFVAVLLPGISAFVPGSVTPSTVRSLNGGRSSIRGVRARSTSVVNMTATNQDKKAPAWDISTFFSQMMGSASTAKEKADTTASEVYAELKKKVLVKQERQGLEGQLCSLLRIAGQDTMSTKSEKCVRRLAGELEALQSNANAFGLDRVSLAGSWKLIYASVDNDGKAAKCADKPSAIEHISYVSEHYRISHTDSGVLKVYKRLEDKKAAAKRREAAATRAAQKTLEDDTATAGLISSGGARGGAVTRKSASKQALSKSAGAAAKQPLRKRMFFGWRR